jgi:hypothetical protein
MAALRIPLQARMAWRERRRRGTTALLHDNDALFPLL